MLPVLLLLVGAGVFSFVLAQPEAAPQAKVEGMVYILGKDCLINLDNGDSRS